MEELANLNETRLDPSLALSYAGLGDELCPAVAEFLKINTFCKFVDLRGNSIGRKVKTN